jgi:hypothetical protein
MIRFTSSVAVAAPIEQVWARITDWPAHGRWIPLTTVWVTSARPDGVGAIFVGRTALGPIGFDDPMEIVEWTPPQDGAPGFCRVEKRGRVVTGWAAFTVQAGPGRPGRPVGSHGSVGSHGGHGGPGGTERSTVHWTENVSIAPGAPAGLGRLIAAADPLSTVLGRFGFQRSLRAMAREVESEVSAGG